MPSTTNFGWTTPADTDLVKDGAAAIRTLAGGIDTSFVDLKGGTTGQNLRKNSNTDLDFTWAGDATNTVIDAEGDLLVGDSADTLQRLAIGTTNQVLTVDTAIDGKVKWATPSAGGITSIASGSFSGGSVVLSSIPATYKHLQLVIRNYRPATDATNLAIRFNGDSTANRYEYGTANTTDNNFERTEIQMQVAQDNGASNNLTQINVFDYANTTTWKLFDSIALGNNATNSANIDLTRNWGAYNQTGAINSITLFPASGNFTSGDYILYGVQ